MDELKNLLGTVDEIREGIRTGQIRTSEGFECRFCFNSGFREALDPRNPHDSRYRGVVRCYECRYWEFRAAKNNY